MKQDSFQAPNCRDFRHVSSTAKLKRQDAPNWKASRPLVNSISPMSVLLFIIRALSFVCKVLLLLLAVATRLVKIIGVALTAYGGSGKKKVNSSKQGRDHLSHKEGTTNIHNMHKGDQSLPNTSAVTTNTFDDHILRSAGTEKHSSSVNNGTEDAFINSGGGHQYFKEAEFNTGVQVAKGRHAPCSGNNGTKSSFRNSSSGNQDFGKAKFNTGANYN